MVKVFCFFWIFRVEFCGKCSFGCLGNLCKFFVVSDLDIYW